MRTSGGAFRDSRQESSEVRRQWAGIPDRSPESPFTGSRRVVLLGGGHDALARLGSDLSTALGEERDRDANRVRRAAAHGEAVFLLDVLAKGQALYDSAQPGPITTGVAAQLVELRTILRAQAAETA